MCIPTFFLDRIAAYFSVHQQIKTGAVRSATLYRSGDGERSLTDDEIADIVKDYNQLVFIMKRSQPVADPPLASISLDLHSGDRVDILLSGEDLDIMRNKNNKTIVYWAKQDALKTFLTQALHPQP